VPNEVGPFVPPEAVFPGTPATAEVLIEVLATLSRDDTLFHCAHANTIVSGHASLAAKEPQQILLTTLCTHDEIYRINTFGVWRAHRLFPLPRQSISLTTARTRSQQVNW